jgi:hypothetical protein
MTCVLLVVPGSQVHTWISMHVHTAVCLITIRMEDLDDSLQPFLLAQYIRHSMCHLK